MTRDEWLKKRQEQGIKIYKCSECDFKLPAHLLKDAWWHEFETGHASMIEVK